MGDYAVGCIHDHLRRAVVLLQPEQLRLRVIFPETENVLDPGAAETVDTLRIVAHHANIVVAFCQILDNQVLDIVCVLVLVHQNIPEPGGDGLHGVRMILEEDEHVEQDVVKIHRAGLLAFFGVAGINVHQSELLPGAVFLLQLRVFAIGRYGAEIVFGQRNAALDIPGFIDFVVQFEFLDALFDGALRIRLVPDGELLRIAEPVCKLPQEADKDRMERAHADPARLALPHQGGDTLLHLPGRFLGEGQCHHLARLYIMGQQPGDTAGQNAGFATAGTGNDQGRALRLPDRFCLGWVQSLKDALLFVLHDSAKIVFLCAEKNIG